MAAGDRWIDLIDPRREDLAAKLPYPGILLKQEQDLDLVQQRREGKR